ncbi:MAG: glutamate formimidoyltransferase [Acidobacteria bacterium]|nr:glutamate formimidoyltransferase [Acidobacteriota bacterium]
MDQIVECIPNFSEGRDTRKIELIASTIAAVPDVCVLDRTMDYDHNRAVITFAGAPHAVVEAAVRAAATAVELIDLNQHDGQHLRMGALDVLPFVPIRGVSMEECVQLARQAGQRIAEELNIPVYLYEKAATRPDRVDLANVRRGEFEGLREVIESDPDRRPDFGSRMIHPTAGAMAVGARAPLIAYNINLGTSDLSVAKKIAKAVRGSSGGLQFVKAWGIDLQSRRCTQVSMNLTNYEATPLFRAFELVEREAQRYGVNVISSEVVGLVPQAALHACTDYFLRLDNFSDDLVLERRLQRAFAERSRAPLSPDDHQAATRLSALTAGAGAFADADADAEPETYTMDGASVTAYVGSLAAALGELVCSLTIRQKKDPKKKDVEEEARNVLEQLRQWGEELRLAVQEQDEGRERFLDAVNLPRGSEAEQLARTIAIEDATKNAVAAPLRVAQAAESVLELLSELSEIGTPSAFTDLTIAAQLAMTAMRGAAYSVLSSLLNIRDEEFNRERREEVAELMTRGQELAVNIEALFFRLYPR